MNIKRKSLRSKAHQFPRELGILSEYLRALSHPARLAVLQTLARRGECVCGEIVNVVPLAQSTVSQHLKQLRDVGLIQGEVEGTKSCYCLDMKSVAELRALLTRFCDQLEALGGKHKLRDRC